MQQRLRYPKLMSAYGSSRKNPGTGSYISHNAAQSYCFFFCNAPCRATEDIRQQAIVMIS